jgi:hypothetical protein
LIKLNSNPCSFIVISRRLIRPWKKKISDRTSFTSPNYFERNSSSDGNRILIWGTHGCRIRVNTGLKEFGLVNGFPSLIIFFPGPNQLSSNYFERKGIRIDLYQMELFSGSSPDGTTSFLLSGSLSPPNQRIRIKK